MNVLIVTGDRDTFQLISDKTTVLYNSRGVSDMKRYDPAGLLEKYGLTPAQYPDFAALRGDTSDNLPSHPRGRGEDRDEVDHGVRLARGPGQPGRRGQGQGGRRAARAPGQRAAQPPAHHAAPRPAGATVVGATPADLGPAAVGPGDDPPALRHPPVPGAARPPLPDLPRRPARRDHAGRRGRRGPPTSRSRRHSRSTHPSSAPRRSPAGWKSTHRPNGRGLLLTGSWGRGTGSGDRHRDRRPRWHRAPTSTRRRSPPTTSAPWRSGWRRREHPKALHDAKGPMHALASHGFVLNGLTSRHRTSRISRTARPADLRPRRPRAALPRQGAARRPPGTTCS